MTTQTEREPPRSLSGRLRQLPDHVRSLAAPRGATDVPPWFGRLREVVALSLASPARRLAELGQRAFLEYGCPACHQLGTTSRRASELIVRGLGNRATAQAYEEARGLCLRDLPLALRYGPEPDARRLLLRTARVRLEVLGWEIEELRRKEAWTARHEPKGLESSAAERLAAQVSGVDSDECSLIGLE